MALCKLKRKSPQNLKAFKRKKQEIKKLQQLLNNSDKNVELKTKLKDKNYLLEFKNMLLIMQNQLRMN